MEATVLEEPKLVDADKFVHRTACGSGTTDDPAVDESPSTIKFWWGQVESP